MEVDLRGRKAVLTGLPDDLGDAVARALRANGAAVSATTDHPATLPEGATILVVFAREPDAAAPDRVATLCRDAAGRMAEGGRIVVVTTALGVVPMRGAAMRAAGAAALLSMVRGLAMEFAARGVLVNAVCVGAVEGGADAARMLSHVPVARAGRAEEIGAAVLFLVDPDNSYTTGHVMVVDGGWVAGYARNF